MKGGGGVRDSQFQWEGLSGEIKSGGYLHLYEGALNEFYKRGGIWYSLFRENPLPNLNTGRY